MLCAQEEMEMASSQGKKEEITLAVIFVIIVGIVVKVAMAGSPFSTHGSL